MQATAALGEILQTEELEAIVKEHYYLFASTLLLRFGTANGSPEVPSRAMTSITTSSVIVVFTPQRRLSRQCLPSSSSSSAPRTSR